MRVARMHAVGLIHTLAPKAGALHGRTAGTSYRFISSHSAAQTSPAALFDPQHVAPVRRSWR